MFQRSPLLARALTTLLLVAGASAPGFAAEPVPAPPAPPALPPEPPAVVFDTPAPAPAATPAAIEGTARFMGFMLEVFGGGDALKKISINQAGNDQEMRGLLTRAMDAHFDSDALVHRIAQAIAGHLTEDEIAEAVRFVDSEDGKLLLATTRTGATMQEKIRSLDSLPADTQQRLQAALAQPGIDHIMRLMNSSEAMAVSHAYGEKVMCDYIADTDHQGFQSLLIMGKCKDP